LKKDPNGFFLFVEGKYKLAHLPLDPQKEWLSVSERHCKQLTYILLNIRKLPKS
jgi:hypothetical protein